MVRVAQACHRLSAEENPERTEELDSERGRGHVGVRFRESVERDLSHNSRLTTIFLPG